MKIKLLLPLVLASCAACLVSCKAHTASEPTLSPEPISAESLAIYRSILAPKEGRPIFPYYISELTFPFRPDGDWIHPGCLNQFRKSDFKSHTIHKFSADAFPPPNRVVAGYGKAKPLGMSGDDAVKNGFCGYHFSEIVYDSTHTHAALTASFSCFLGDGPINMGWTETYEKQNGVWKSARGCGSWAP